MNREETAGALLGSEASNFPRPFYTSPWPASSRAAARALWHWHLSLLRAPKEGMSSEQTQAFVSDEYERVLQSEPVRIVPEMVWISAYRACEEHGLDRVLLAEQIKAAPILQGKVRFATAQELDAFLKTLVAPHARLLAHLAEAAHSWQIQYVDELARAFFIVGRLIELPRDLDRDQLFIPLSDLEQAKVSAADLKRGLPGEAMRRLLWKQAIRARDAFAHGMPLVEEVSPRFAREIKRWVLGGLEILHQIERRNYDLWSSPVRLSYFQRLQVHVQARFGRISFRRR